MARRDDLQLISVSDWEGWFAMCGELAPVVEDYERRLWAWDVFLWGARDAGAHYRARHVRDFWDKDPKVTARLAKVCGIALLASGALGIVCSMALAFASVGAFALSGVVPAFFYAWPRGLVIAALFFATFVCGLVVRRNFLLRWFRATGDYVASGIRYVPPKYRNAFCLDALFHLWSDYGIESYAVALDKLDIHIRNNAAVYVPVHIMCDVPFSSADDPASDPGFAEANTDDDEPNVMNPALPADIRSHTERGVDDAEAALAELIGIEGVKRQVRQMKRRIQFYDGKGGNQGGNNIMLIGSAGVGKTVVARILTRILFDFGYVSKNRIVEVDGDYLKSPYVGQTGERVSAIVEWAMGGVLFVDEAYLLFNERDNSSVGAEATGVLLKAMEDHRQDFVVILAGYEDGMNRLVASNEGFASRIKHKIYFDDYTDEELVQIFELFLRKSGSKVTEIEDEAKALLRQEFDAESRLSNFGNARAARNACDALLDIHADRFVEGLEDASKERVITLGDVEAYVEHQKSTLAADRRNFMAANHIDSSIISASDLKSRTKRGVEDWERSLEALVGMDEVKRQMRQFKERADFFRDEIDLDDADMTLNSLFIGPAGTGKTSVAAIMTSMLYHNGYIRENRYLDITGDFLKASYVGQTGKRTEAVIEYAKGMVLFIDEAYLLAGEGQNDFGAEAIGVLVDAMEKNRGDLVIILAGYEREMSELLDKNSGLSSRISTTFRFERYGVRDLLYIMQRMAAARGFAVDKAAWAVVRGVVERHVGEPNFGNGRYMRQLLQAAVSTHASRWNAGEVDAAHRRVIEAADITDV